MNLRTNLGITTDKVEIAQTKFLIKRASKSSNNIADEQVKELVQSLIKIVHICLENMDSMLDKIEELQKENKE